jgi:hypothetical protein
MRRSKNLLGFRSLFVSASSASPPSNSPFRVTTSSGANNGGGGGGFYGSNGGIPVTASSSTSAMMDRYYWHAQNPVLSGSARVALVALLSLFALGNLYVANQARSEQGPGGVMGVFGAGSAPSTHHVRGVTMRESWITPASQPFVRSHRSFTLRVRIEHPCARCVVMVAYHACTYHRVCMLLVA